MLLVRGGYFRMGFDGHHSRAMKTEPIHKVTLSSYYISKGDISKYVWLYLQNKDNENKKTDGFAKLTWKQLNDFIVAFNKFTGMSYRITTEAEWEYAARLFGPKGVFSINLDWCSDFYGKYPAYEQTDPKGPDKGRMRVKRKYIDSNKKFDRSTNLIKISDASFHLVIAVDEYVKIHGTKINETLNMKK